MLPETPSYRLPQGTTTGAASGDRTPDVTIDSEETSVPDLSSRPRWSTADTLAISMVTLLGALLRLWRLGVPSHPVFDEQFYANDACHYATGMLERCGLRGTIVEVHPPVAKWIIGAGIKVFGYNSFGTRIAPVLAGTVLIALTYLLARKLFSHRGAPVIASTYVAIDLLLFVQSRLAMLEIFLTLFIVAAFLGLVYDRERTDPASRRWRWLTGVALGLALGTKWVAAPVLLVVPVLCFVWERRRDKPSGILTTIKREGWSIVVGFLIIPAAVYVASYIGRVDGGFLEWPGDVTSWWSAFWGQQVFMWDYLSLPRALYSFRSFAWEWLFARATLPYHLQTLGGTTAGGIMAAGIATMWIPVIPATFYAFVRWIRSRDSVVDVLVPLVAFACTYGLWLLPSLFGFENFFLYYLTPSIPFMALLVAAAITPLLASKPGRWFVGSLVASWFLLFAFVYPLVGTVRVPLEAWQARTDLYEMCPVSQDSIARTEEVPQVGEIVRLLDTLCETSVNGP